MTQALRRAADLLDQWAKDVGYAAMLNETDPDADEGTKLYAACLTALVSRARADAADFRVRVAIREAAGPAQPEGDDNG